tara:strand:- start:3937 stop:4146 length:210 start_codon:yes stop_codon:yes gene_type:complete
MEYSITEEKVWAREGCNNRSLHTVEHAGYELKVIGYRIVRNGAKIFVAYPPFATVEAAAARIAELKAVA